MSRRSALTNINCRRNPELDNGQYRRARDLSTARFLKLLCPDRKDAVRGEKLYQLNFYALLAQGTVEVRIKEAADFEQALPFVGLCMALAGASVQGAAFCAEAYREAVKNEPLLALLTPFRPTSHPAHPVVSASQPVTG